MCVFVWLNVYVWMSVSAHVCEYGCDSGEQFMWSMKNSEGCWIGNKFGKNKIRSLICISYRNSIVTELFYRLTANPRSSTRAAMSFQLPVSVSHRRQQVMFQVSHLGLSPGCWRHSALSPFQISFKNNEKDLVPTEQSANNFTKNKFRWNDEHGRRHTRQW